MKIVTMYPKRMRQSFNWKVEEPELLVYAVNIADLWLDRELKEKGYITADHLNKACGILSEEIMHSMLCELSVPHVRTVPLLSKEHPVNAGKPYDIKIEDSTIDIKAIAPLPPPSGHHCNLNAKKGEIDKYGKCDFYICSKCYPELPAEERPKPENRKVSKKWALEILRKVERVQFLGYATASELIKEKNLVRTKKPFYSLHPPFHSMDEFAKRFNIHLT